MGGDLKNSIRNDRRVSYYGLMKQSQVEVPGASYPGYVDGDIGLPVFRGPYLQQDAQMAAFLFSVDSDRLAVLCDQYLNAPCDKQIRYVPLLPNVVVIFADMFVSSLDERDRKVGRMPETEVSFWVLTVAMRRVGRVYVPDHLAWFLPYLFVDNSNAIATGREVYGFNKLMGRFQKPQHIQRPEFSMDVFGFKEFNPEAKGEMGRLLEIRCTDHATGDEPVDTWESWDNAKTDIDQELLKSIEADPKSKVIEFVARLINDNMPIVFLKQFRDVSNTHQACYQAIVEAPIKMQQFHQGGFLSGGYVMSVNHLDSHPLAHTLGLRLENGEQRSVVGVWMKVDFILGGGIEVWKAA
jgi:hypothetical protein